MPESEGRPTEHRQVPEARHVPAGRRDSLELMYEVCRAAVEISHQVTLSGQSSDQSGGAESRGGPAQALEEAMLGLSLSQDELMSVWSLFLLASQLAKGQYAGGALHGEQATYYLQTPGADMP